MQFGTYILDFNDSEWAIGFEISSIIHKLLPDLESTMVDTATTSASLSDSNLNGRPDVRHTVYLITGANRGIYSSFVKCSLRLKDIGLGKSLVELLLKRSYTIVIACVRDMTTAPSGALDWQDSPAAANSSLIVIQLDSTKTHAAQEAVRQLRVVHSINHIDVVIANAGICNDQGSMSNLPLEDLQEHMMVNAHAVLLLFQATQPLLEEAGTGQARFVLIGAQAGCITAENMGAVPLAAYSLSKLAAHFMIRRLHLENDWLVSFVVDPG